jgi:hypothetical protein
MLTPMTAEKVDKRASKSPTLPCDRCRTPMQFVTAISDSMAPRRMRLFECSACALTAFVPEA